MDRDVMERPERKDRNFSIVVPHSTYTNLKVMAFHMETSLGGVCRQLLAMVTPLTLRRLREVSAKEGIGIVPLCKQLLEEGLNKRK